MSLLFSSTGHEAIGHPAGDPQQLILIAAVGSFALTGENALFSATFSAATGVFVFTGEPTTPVKVFPGSLSRLDSNSMAILATAGPQTLLYDYGSTEDFYLIDTGQLYYVGAVYAQSWLRVTRGPGQTVLYNPFTRASGRQ